MSLDRLLGPSGILNRIAFSAAATSTLVYILLGFFLIPFTPYATTTSTMSGFIMALVWRVIGWKMFGWKGNLFIISAGVACGVFGEISYLKIVRSFVYAAKHHIVVSPVLTPRYIPNSLFELESLGGIFLQSIPCIGAFACICWALRPKREQWIPNENGEDEEIIATFT